MPVRRADDTLVTTKRKNDVRAWLIARGHPVDRVNAMVIVTELDLTQQVITLHNLTRAQYDGGGLG